MRKKPSRDGSGIVAEVGEVTDTEETETLTWPDRVNPNFSKRIIGLSSSEIVRDFISADARVMKVEAVTRRRRRETKRGDLVISRRNSRVEREMMLLLVWFTFEETRMAFDPIFQAAVSFC